MNAKILPIDIKTTFLVCLFDFPDFDSVATVGPSACLVGTGPEPEDGTTKNGAPGGAPGGAVTWERGAGARVDVELLSLNGFPACLHNKHHHLSYRSYITS
jgi:hypothetical protein